MIDDAGFGRTNLEAIAAIGGLQVIGVQPILPAQLKHTLHWSRDVLVQTVRELDDDDGTFAGRPQQAPDDGSTRLPAYFAKDDFHDPNLA